MGEPLRIGKIEFDGVELAHEPRSMQRMKGVAAEQEIRRLRKELVRAITTIQAEHRYKAAQGGAPCVCEYCKGDER